MANVRCEVFCPKCGNELPNTAKFCTQCGATIDENRFARSKQSANGNVEGGAADPGKPAAKLPGGSFKYVIGVVAIVAVLFIGINAVTGGGDAQDGKPAANTQAQRVEPRNLEEWLAVNEPNWPNSYRNDLLKQAPIMNVADYQVGVSGNQVTVIALSNVAKSDIGFLGKLFDTYVNDFVDEATEGSWMAGWSQLAQSLEADTGIRPITVHVEVRYADGAIATSYDFNSSGRTN